MSAGKNSHKTINVDGIGPVLLERSRRARRLIISVRADGRVRVAVPLRTSYRHAEEFVGAKAQWIRKQQRILRAARRACSDSLAELGRMDYGKAGRMLAARLDELAARHGFEYGRVSVRRQKTRWGSCSAKHNISLNLKLAALPQELIDYVIIHELVHTRVKNHSQEFWSELTRHIPDGRQRSRELRKYGSVLL